MHTATPREHNRQADYLCHLTLERKQSWHDVLVEPSEFDFQECDYLAGWSDGGYDGLAGGTAAYIVAVQKGSVWTQLCMGGVYDASTTDNDSLRMEAIGMEHLFSKSLDYLICPFS